jgi:hypothetical protein
MRGDRQRTTLDTTLAEGNIKRTIGARGSAFLVVPDLLARTDMLATLPLLMSEVFLERSDLRAAEPPLPIAPWRSMDSFGRDGNPFRLAAARGAGADKRTVRSRARRYKSIRYMKTLYRLTGLAPTSVDRLFQNIARSAMKNSRLLQRSV